MLKGKVLVGKKNMNEPVLYRNLAADKDYKDIMKEQFSCSVNCGISVYYQLDSLDESLSAIILVCL